MQITVDTTKEYGGRQFVGYWPSDTFYAHENGARIQGTSAFGKKGVAVTLIRDLPATLYTGELFDNNTAVILPADQDDLPAIWAFCSSSVFSQAVRLLDQKLGVTNSTLVKVPFDVTHWQQMAKDLYPNGLPDPASNDPTQWVFKGTIKESQRPLQVATARLLNYSWPDQEPDGLREFLETDGVLCIPALGGQQDGPERLRALLAYAYGKDWQPGLLDQLLSDTDFEGKSLDQWLRDGFFEQHCRLFEQRPFIWQLWDGRRDGFSALVNYHTLDHAKLQKLTYTYLGTWIDRQKDLSSQGIAGADDRLAAAVTLQRKLAQILEGEKPFDIYVRWKKKHEQPIGWNPDLDDGVRLNIRPFMEAGVLRWKPNIKWEKDRGKNPDGSDRINDIHLSLSEKSEARRAAGVT
jgi:hypothetical protein